MNYPFNIVESFCKRKGFIFHQKNDEHCYTIEANGKNFYYLALIEEKLYIAKLVFTGNESIDPEIYKILLEINSPNNIENKYVISMKTNNNEIWVHGKIESSNFVENIIENEMEKISEVSETLNKIICIILKVE